MTAVREWLDSVVVLAVLVSVLRTLTPEGVVRKISAFTGGLLLLAALLQPFVRGRLKLNTPDWERFAEEITRQETDWEEDALHTLGARVASGTETVIAREASARGLVVRAEVSVRRGNGVPLPASVVLYGAYDTGLSRWIAEELDIPPERQTWVDREWQPENGCYQIH